MLQKMRAFSKSKFSAVLLGLLSLAFVSWGVGDVFQGSISTAVVTVGGTQVDQSEFSRDYKNFLDRLSNQRGTQITAEEAKREKIGDLLLQRTIITTAMDNVVQRLGLTASDETVLANIRAMPQFFGVSGSFDKTVFADSVGRLGYGENGFIAAVRGDLARAQLTQAVEGGFTLPTGYARALFAVLAETRAVEYTVVKPEQLPPTAAPTEAVLAAYVKAHPERYSTPEYRDVTYAAVSPADFLDKVKVTDELLRQEYENNKAKFVIEEKRVVERLTFQDKKEAEDAVAKLRGGAKFLDVLKAAGFAPDDLDSSEVTAKELADDEAKAVFALPLDGVTAPIQSEFGWTIFHVAKITPGSTKPFDQAKEELRPVVAQKLARAMLDDVSNTYTDASSSGLTIAEAAKKAGMKVHHIVAMDRNGLAPDGTKTEAPDDAEFRDGVFKADVGEEGDPLLSKANTLFVILVNGQTPPKLKPVDAVREAAVQAWTAEQRKKAIEARANAIAAQANKTKSLAAAVKTYGLTVENSKALLRRSTDDTMSAALVAKVFEAMPGTAVVGPLGKGDGFVVARITGIARRPPSEKEDYFQQALLMLSQREVAPDLTTSLAFAARDEQGYTVNNKLFEGTIGGGEGQ